MQADSCLYVSLTYARNVWSKWVNLVKVLRYAFLQMQQHSIFSLCLETRNLQGTLPLLYTFIFKYCKTPKGYEEKVTRPNRIHTNWKKSSLRSKKSLGSLDSSSRTKDESNDLSVQVITDNTTVRSSVKLS